ncbi:hypothetical protein QVD17_10672 [Tagetes erecta]|uniref:Uncharacterized protein n=1 Tax=Tagetes erecta TaxID=13708 RepID=A0AAD8P6I3_TARER|nr:hypothetical protein QVD17_10672 [Tagetes erecta]
MDPQCTSHFTNGPVNKPIYTAVVFGDSSLRKKLAFASSILGWGIFSLYSFSKLFMIESQRLGKFNGKKRGIH